jgi:hypothetical protein
MLIDERERQHVAVQIAHSAHVPRERFARLAIVGRDDDLFSMRASAHAVRHSLRRTAAEAVERYLTTQRHALIVSGA